MPDIPFLIIHGNMFGFFSRKNIPNETFMEYVVRFLFSLWGLETLRSITPVSLQCDQGYKKISAALS